MTGADTARRGGILPFVAGSLAMIIIFSAASAPLGLYRIYRAEDGVTNTDLAMGTVAYFGAAMACLLAIGRLPDRIGRKPPMLAAIALAIGGCIAFLLVDGPWPLIAGRGLCGLAAGIGFTSIGAYAVDTAPARPSWAGSIVTLTGSTAGMTLGAIGGAALVDFAPWPRVLPFAIIVGLLVLCAAAIVASPETVSRLPWSWREIVPRIALPRAALALAVPAACIFAPTWAYGAFIQSFGPSIVQDDLGSDLSLVAAIAVSAYMVPVVLGSPLVGVLRADVAQRLGMIVVAAAGAGIVVATANGWLPLFVVATFAGGLGLGVSNSATIRILLDTATVRERAGLLAGVYAFSYLCGALPSYLAGQAARVADLLTITAVYAIAAALATIVVLATARAPRDRPARAASDPPAPPGTPDRAGMHPSP